LLNSGLYEVVVKLEFNLKVAISLIKEDSLIIWLDTLPLTSTLVFLALKASLIEGINLLNMMKYKVKNITTSQKYWLKKVSKASWGI